MNIKYLYRIECLAVGVLVLFLLLVPLFWIRFLSEAGLMIKAEEYNNIARSPSGLLPLDIEKDPNVSENSELFVRMNIDDFDRPLEWLGWTYFFRSMMEESPRKRIYSHIGSMDMIYFDKTSGHIVVELKLPDGTEEYKRINLHVGSEGVSENKNAQIGRFYDPILAVDENGYYEIYHAGLVLYDKKLRRFFIINFKERTIKSGPKLESGDKYHPVQIGDLNKNGRLLMFGFSPPRKKVISKIPSEDSDEMEERDSWEFLIGWSKLQWATDYTLVLDGSGRIDFLDINTLELVKTVGRLPSCLSYFSSKQNVEPDDLLAYIAHPVTLKMEDPYRGLITASINREGTMMALSVYDSEGKLILTTRNNKYKWRYYFGVAWGPALTIVKYATENLHPPVLSLLSYFTADSFEAESGYRAMFVMPNSFVAMKGRQVDKGEISKLFDAIFFLMGPGLLLSIFLAWRVGRDANLVGMSEEERMVWITAAILFGLAGYITYRVVRPKETLVTCANCGRMRRPDMEFCHRCGAGWDMPELTPPRWRVIS